MNRLVTQHKALLCFILLATLCACADNSTPQQTPGELLPSAEPSVVSTVTTEIKEALPDYTGTWYRTNIPKSSYAVVVISNQTDTTFDYKFEGSYGANSGPTMGTAIFTKNGGAVEHREPPEFYESGEVEFSFIGETLWLNSATADGEPIAPNFNIYLEGEFTRGEPVFTNANLLNEIMPTEETKIKLLELIGYDEYDTMLDIMENGVQYFPADGDEDALTYSGFYVGIGLGVDILLDSNKIYFLAYSGTFRFYTNDAAYKNTLPAAMEYANRTGEPIQFTYKDIDNVVQGYDTENYIAFISKTLSLTPETAKTLKLSKREMAHISKDTTAAVYYYMYPVKQRFFNYHHIVLVDFGDRLICKELAGEDSDTSFYLADIDGDIADEILLNVVNVHSIGTDYYRSYIFKIEENDVTELFENHAAQFETGFTWSFADGFMITVGNKHTDLAVTFEHRYDDGGNPYFNADGTAKLESDDGGCSSSFSHFLPVDVDNDGIFEIMSEHYLSLFGDSDWLGKAYTILRWNNDLDAPEVINAGFRPFEYHPRNEETEYFERVIEYEDNWYKNER